MWISKEEEEDIRIRAVLTGSQTNRTDRLHESKKRNKYKHIHQLNRYIFNYLSSLRVNHTELN